MEADNNRLTLDLDRPVQRRLEMVAGLKGVSVRQYCKAAIDKELARDEASRQSICRPDAERFAELRQRYFSGKTLPGSGVDFIREARESRNSS